MTRDHDVSSITRRQVLAGAGGTGLLAAAAPISARAATRTTAATAADGTPEQIHLTWGNDPASSVTVSWASPDPARRPRVVFRHAGGGSRVVPAAQRVYTDGINSETVWTYHAELTGLRPSSAYGYTVTADNDTSARPFAATFSTAPRPGAVPVHQLRRPGHAEHAVGALLRPERLRGRGRRVVPAAVSPAQRGPVLRQPEPHDPA
jgi:phosphodiesterase/alkaline phosphatase D-like protein